jgi:hypothetical protein
LHTELVTVIGFGVERNNNVGAADREYLMSNATLTKQAQGYLEAVAEELEISETRYEQADARYHSLGRWLNREGSTVRKFEPAVYIQGSFGLGTVIKPLNEKEDYDIDAVCELKLLGKAHVTQADVKELLGLEIEAYRKAQNMQKRLHEGRRCWTLNYADGAQFHMDVVPALPNGGAVRALLEQHHLDARWAGTAIAITDNESPNYRVHLHDWPRSNPKGYLEWFKSRMEVTFARMRKRLAEAVHASVDDIPEYRVRTPLQSAIMILKHHRDIMFQNDEINCCPISIIITTLAAHAYNGEDNIADALLSILSRMDQFIRHDGTKHLIPNPSDPLENFADKWEEFPERAESFFKWLAQARQDFAHAALLTESAQIEASLGSHIGATLAKRAADRTQPSRGSGLRAASVAPIAAAASTPSFGNQPRTPSRPEGFA